MTDYKAAFLKANEACSVREEALACVEAVAVTIERAASEPVENFTANSWRQLLHVAASDIRAALGGVR